MVSYLLPLFSLSPNMRTVDLAYAAVVEAPSELRRRASAGDCIVHENGIVGLDDLALASIVVTARRATRALRTAFRRLRKEVEEGMEEEWVTLPLSPPPRSNRGSSSPTSDAASRWD